MYNFKRLEWHKQHDLNGIYAEPEGLKWNYSILMRDDGKVEFSLLDPYYEYAPNFPQICSSMDEACEKATKHYLSLLKQYVDVDIKTSTPNSQ